MQGDTINKLLTHIMRLGLLTLLAYSPGVVFGAEIAGARISAYEVEKGDTHSPADFALIEAMNRAVSWHPVVESARLQAKAAGVDLKAARWQRFPTVSLETGVFEEDNYVPRTSAVMEQPLWTGGRISASIDRADHKQRAALEGYRESQLEIALGVNTFYIDFQRLSRRLVVVEDSVSQHRRMVETMERRVAQEVSPLSDLELARSRLLQVEQQLSLTESQKNSALQRLRELLGNASYTPGTNLVLPAAWPGMPLETLLAASLEYSPRRQRLLAETSAADADSRIIIAGTLPQLSGQYSYNELYGYRFGVVLKAQADSGLSRFAAADAARLRRDASGMQVGAVERDIRDQITADHIEYRYASQRIGNAEASAQSTQNVTDSYMRQFISGRRSWLDVMNAVRESTSSRLDAIDAAASASSALNRLLIRSGSWQPTSLQVNP